IALSIEPTDGVFYPGIVAFDHISGFIRRNLGAPPAMSIAIFDVGGQVDTVSFNQRTDLAALNTAKEKEVREAFDLVAQGIATGDCRRIGKGATISARANQSILYKPCLEDVIQTGARYGAMGVNAAHSGTVLGVLFAGDSEPDAITACVAEITANCRYIRYLRTVNLVSGGLRIEGDRHYE
ncbi:MAG: GHMP kinase, partial [Negativicutes bacterium]|nr:GHMP kinase [Negativicutes bacterium]